MLRARQRRRRRTNPSSPGEAAPTTLLVLHCSVRSSLVQGWPQSARGRLAGKGSSNLGLLNSSQDLSETFLWSHRRRRWSCRQAHREERQQHYACCYLQATVDEERDHLPQVVHAPDPCPPGSQLIAQLPPLRAAQPEPAVVQVQRHIRQRRACAGTLAPLERRPS